MPWTPWRRARKRKYVSMSVLMVTVFGFPSPIVALVSHRKFSAIFTIRFLPPNPWAREQAWAFPCAKASSTHTAGRSPVRVNRTRARCFTHLSQPKEERGRREMKRILVIDDDEAVRKLFLLSLEGTGYRVYTVSSGMAGVTAF